MCPGWCEWWLLFSQSCIKCSISALLCSDDSVKLAWVVVKSGWVVVGPTTTDRPVWAHPWEKFLVTCRPLESIIMSSSQHCFHGLFPCYVLAGELFPSLIPLCPYRNYDPPIWYDTTIKLFQVHKVPAPDSTQERPSWNARYYNRINVCRTLMHVHIIIVCHNCECFQDQTDINFNATW